MKKLICSLALACACALSPESHATSLVGVSGSGIPVSFQEHQYLAQQFAFTGTAALDSLTLNFSGTTGGSFPALLQITDALGAGANTLFSTSFAVQDGAVSIPTATTLTPGAYFFVLSTTAGLPSFSTLAATGENASETFGAVGLSFFSVSQNIANPEQSPFAALGNEQRLVFELDGEFTGVHDLAAARALLGPVRVPDVANTFPLLAAGLLAMIGLKRFTRPFTA